jgi:hypothetical protein
LIQKSNVILILLLVLSLSVTSSFSKQVSAISEGATSIINNLITTFGPTVSDAIDGALNPEKPPSVGDRSPPTIESPQFPANDPCADPALADLCQPQGGPGLNYPYAPPYDPLSVMNQYWAQFESQLNYLTPEEKQIVLSEVGKMLELELESYPPLEKQRAIQILQQTMSPELSEMLLPT